MTKQDKAFAKEFIIMGTNSNNLMEAFIKIKHSEELQAVIMEEFSMPYRKLFSKFLEVK